LSLVVLKDVVECFDLKVGIQFLQDGIKLLAKIAHCQSLVAAVENARPQQVDVIGHAAVDGAAKAEAKRRVREEFAKLVIERWDEPAGFSIFDC
jgi:hypothetical protein